ncbi:hypothetical protein [Streptomyces tubercidicus]
MHDQTCVRAEGIAEQFHYPVRAIQEEALLALHALHFISQLIDL